MFRAIAPLQQRLRHLPQPALFRRHGQDGPASDLSTGQLIAEQVATNVGSWRFIGAQAGVMALWVVFNVLVFTRAIHFDEYPFVFLNLAMSAEAAFTGPILLIAANVGAQRDHRQADRIERLVRQAEAESEKSDAHTAKVEAALHTFARQSEDHYATLVRLSDEVERFTHVLTAATGQQVERQTVLVPIAPRPGRKRVSKKRQFDPNDPIEED